MEEGTWTDHGEVFHSRKGDIFNASKQSVKFPSCAL